jgi:hypothetical protein
MELVEFGLTLELHCSVASRSFGSFVILCDCRSTDETLMGSFQAIVCAIGLRSCFLVSLSVALSI